MSIQEQTALNSSAQWTVRPSSSPDAEWTATPLRPVATWVLVPLADGAARLEMVWRVPDPRTADLA